MTKLRKPEVWWCFKYKDGTLVYGALELRKKDVVAWAERNFKTSWSDIKSYGHTIVKVEVKEVGNG